MAKRIRGRGIGVVICSNVEYGGVVGRKKGVILGKEQEQDP